MQRLSLCVDGTSGPGEIDERELKSTDSLVCLGGGRGADCSVNVNCGSSNATMCLLTHALKKHHTGPKEIKVKGL